MTPYYQHAGITIYHGDCRPIRLSLPSIDAVISDPPYGMGDKSDRSTRLGGNVNLHSEYKVSRKWDVIHGDDAPFDPAMWLSFPRVVLFGAVHFSSHLPESRCWLVWDKREGGTADDNADCDFAWTNLPGPARLYSQLWRGLCRKGIENAKRLHHPHQKPMALMTWIIQQCRLPPNSLILDPYMGSGTTLRAAKDAGQNAIGIEIEERYCEIAANRLSQEVMQFP